MTRWCAALVCAALACGNPPRIAMPAHERSPLAADAVAGVTDPTLSAVIADHWEYMMIWAPTWATTLGDHRFDDRLAPRDVAAIERAAAERDVLLARVQAIQTATLGDLD